MCFVSSPGSLQTPRYFLCSPLSDKVRSSVRNPEDFKLSNSFAITPSWDFPSGCDTMMSTSPHVGFPLR